MSSDSLNQQSGNQFYSQRLSSTNSVWANTDITVPESFSESSTFIPPSNYCSNSHLSLLAMVDCRAHLGINTFVHLDLATTQLFRLFLDVAERLFQSLTLLESALHPTIYDHWHRVDDLEFVHCCKKMESIYSFWRLQEEIRGGWGTWQWDDQGSDGCWSHQGRRGKKRLGALSDCKVTITIIKYSVRFSCSICGHRFHQIPNFGDKMQYCVLITMKTGNYSPAAIGTYLS